MAVASVSKITAASPASFDAAVQEGLTRASKTLRGITGLHVIEQKASVSNGKIDGVPGDHGADLHFGGMSPIEGAKSPEWRNRRRNRHYSPTPWRTAARC